MIERYNYEGDTNIGLAATGTVNAAIFPPDFRMEDFFDVESSATTFIAGTRLAGLFTAGNSSCILLPSNLKENELEQIEHSGLSFHQLDSKETALGNLVEANDSGALVSPRLEKHVEEIENALGVEAETIEIAGAPTPGVGAVCNEQGLLLHRDVSEGTAERAADVLGVENVDIGTVNLGSPYVGSGMVVSGESVLVGEDTSGPEVGRIDRTLVTQG